MCPERPVGSRAESAIFFVGREAFVPTVLAARPLHEWGDVQAQVIRSDARIAELLLGFVRDTADARADTDLLLDVIADYSFRAFPGATHHALLSSKIQDAQPETLSARARGGLNKQAVMVSRTIVERVMADGCALLYTHSTDGADSSQSILLSRMETAICAPLMDRHKPFGVIQLDIRRPGRGNFTRDDVDLLSVFASQVSLALEHLRMSQQQRLAFESTISALLHSLTLKDPESARHSERVQAVAIDLGRHLGLSADELEVLRVAALLHDLGKQGVSDTVLFKPDTLTDEEREEMSRHAAHTQEILDKIIYPEHLRDVPRIAAWHHEKLDGTGPFGIAGGDLPFESRILAVADVFDALISQRVYRDPMPPGAVLAILKRGRGTHWDQRVVAAVQDRIEELLARVYGSASSEPDEGVSKAA